jgi:hypothetical protein
MTPAGGAVTRQGETLLIDDVIVDYQAADLHNTCEQVQASPYRLKGDVNGDCVVNPDDLAYITQRWVETSGGWADRNRDQKVNISDVAVLAQDWLECNDPMLTEYQANW